MQLEKSFSYNSEAEHYIELYAKCFQLYGIAKDIELNETAVKVLALICKYRYDKREQLSMLLIHKLKIFKNETQLDRLLSVLINKGLLTVNKGLIALNPEVNFKTAPKEQITFIVKLNVK